ncbi:MAG: DUF935 domain-containing protein, partial [Desulfovibrio sp.]|nr:DUF935 domain-containing protein [Desulfovibrio sp.]
MVLMRPFRRSLPRRPGAAPQPGRQQTEDSGMAASLLYLEQLPDLTHGLTPNKLRRILRDADAGIISEQHALFASMEERCDHLAAEMGKRKRSLLTLEWDILPAVKDDAKAREAAKQVRAMVDALPSVDDIILDMADAIGHGFSA